MQLQSFYEQKILNYKEREAKEEQENKKEQQVPGQSTKKVLSEDQLIFKMMSKINLEKNKDQDNEEKFLEAKNQAVQFLVEGEAKLKKQSHQGDRRVSA